MRILSPLILFLSLLLLPTGVLCSTTLVDLLSSSPDHSLLLGAFQRTRLIPILNQLNESTLFAPTNKAIRDAAAASQDLKGGEERANSWSSLLLLLNSDSLLQVEEQEQEQDNLHLQLRETLLYHCLNFTLFPSPSSNSSNSSSKEKDLLPLDRITLQETLYFPSLSNGYDEEFPPRHPPSLPGSPPDDENKPRFPVSRPKGLLKYQGQRLRVIRRKSRSSSRSVSKNSARRKTKEEEEEEELWIGVDWKGNGGIKTLFPSSLQFAKNGVLIPIDTVLSKPSNLASIIESTPSLSIFHSLLPSSLIDYLRNTSHLTIFAPTNEAWKGVSDLEMRYLKSKFSELDMKEIVGDSSTRNAVITEQQGVVGYLNELFEGAGRGGGSEKVVSIETSRNGTLELTTSSQEEEGVKVNNTLIEQGDILASNGVLHTLPSLLLPSGSLALTAEKYLLALNCTRFVELLHSVNLSDRVQIPSKTQDTTIEPNPLPHLTTTSQLTFSFSTSLEEKLEKGYTILALKDSLIDENTSESVMLLTLPSFPSPGSKELHSLLSYHLLPSKFLPKDLKDEMLVETELRIDSLRGDRQKLMVAVQSEEGGEGEGWEKKKGGGGGGGKKGDEDDEEEVIISFGNANAIAEPVEVGNSIIYLISTILEPPTSLISTAVSDLRLSTFVASVYSSQLDKTFVSTPSITYLIPTNQAFEKLGLVMSYLLLPNAKKELESLLRYHAVDQLVYSKDFLNDDDNSSEVRGYQTLSLDGSEIYLQKQKQEDSKNSTLTTIVHGPTIGGIPLNGEQRSGQVIEVDQLIETGLYHLIDQVELPPTLEINLDKLMKGARVSTMVELIREVGMDWVLKGLEEPSRKEEEEEVVKRRRAYTILVPSDKALSRLNLTYYLNHPQQLEQLVRLHVIPISDSIISTSNSKGSEEGESFSEGLPISLSDSISYTTLHSRELGGRSKFGKVAFKKWGTERGSWMVGIQGARGTKGESDSARIVNWGRATPLISEERGNTTVEQGGGIILIDSVLLPWEPGWFRKWGWIVLAVLVGTSLVVLVGVWGVKKWKKRLRKNGEGYERVEGEED